MTILHAFAYYALGAAAGFVIGWQTARKFGRPKATQLQEDSADDR
jgi:hypothetical protein